MHGEIQGAVRANACAPAPQEHGALVFESRRFVELRKQSFWRQLTSSESTGMGIFYTLNVFCIQARITKHKSIQPAQTPLLHAQRVLHPGAHHNRTIKASANPPSARSTCSASRRAQGFFRVGGAE
jgi:hypothetical protein